MSDVLINQDTMEDIGDSIRSKLGVQTTYLPSEMPNAIMSISGGGEGGSVSGSSPFIDSSGASVELNSTTTAGGTWTATMDCFVTFYANWSGNKFFEIYIDESARILYPYNVSYSNANRFEYVYVKKGQVLKWKFSDNSSNYHIVTAWPLLKNEALQTALIYSEEEREVGVWTDGKPLYQKTFVYTPSALSERVDLSTLDIDTAPNIFGTFVRATGSTYGNYDYPLLGRSEGASYNTYGISVRYEEKQKELVVSIGGYTLSEIGDLRITLQYTKTTDTPGSGIWTTTGEYAHHYSITEHVIGTWIDGKTLYEKTIIATSTEISNHTYTDSAFTNIETRFIYGGFYKMTNGQNVSLNGYENSSTYSRAEFRTNNTIYLYCEGYTVDSAIITVRYTKTTD